MKILYLTPGIYNSAGTERVLSIKANYLVKENYDVIIATTDQKGRNSFFNFDERIKLYDFGLNYEDDFQKNLIVKVINHYRKNSIYKKKLIKLIEEERPDICVSLGGKEIEFINSMNLICKTIFELHFSKRHYYNTLTSIHTGFLWNFIALLMDRMFIKYAKKFDTLVVLTKKDKTAWERTNKNVVQIYNPLPYNYDVLSELNEKNIISVGRLSPQKNYENLIEVWRIVHLKHPDWTMNVWGEGELKEKLQSKIISYGMANTFILRGKTNNIGQEYLRSSAYVMSSKYEGFPMVLLEASSYGLPLVSYDCECGPSDIISDGDNGYLVEDGNVIGLADAICKIIEDKDRRVNMGKKAKQKSYLYAKENILPQWPLLFNSLFSSSNH